MQGMELGLQDEFSQLPFRAVGLTSGAQLQLQT
jgi:hypothetical protein